MTKKKIQTPATALAPAPAHVPLTPVQRAEFAVRPSVNAAIVVDAFQGNLTGKNGGLPDLITQLTASMQRSEDGDLRTVESMLIGQATALQSIFTSLAKRAAHQDRLDHYEKFLTLALKAQSQSRATISALVDLKYPRQATFVAQANIAHGPQQVNNGAAPPVPVTHGKENEFAKNKLLEANHGQPGDWMDNGAAAATKRSHQAVEAVGKIHRAEKPRG